MNSWALLGWLVFSVLALSALAGGVFYAAGKWLDR